MNDSTNLMENLITKKTFLISGFLLLSVVGVAQTVNTGELSVAPGTIISTGGLHNAQSAVLINDGKLYLDGDYKNDGEVTFTPNTASGTTYLNGKKGVQEITGDGPIELNNVEFNNTSGIEPAFHLDNYVQIFGTAYFKKGVVDGESYGGLAVFENGSSHQDASDQSYMKAEVRKVGDEAFMYPVGSSGMYSPMGISAPENKGDSFTGKYFAENSNSLYPHNNKSSNILIIDNAEYWKIDRTSGNSKVFVTLTWNEGVTPKDIYEGALSDIHIVRWDEDKQQWVDEGGAANDALKQVSMVVDPKAGGVFTLARVVPSAPVGCDGNEIVIYNAISPDGDGINDYFNITGLDECPNTVEIYNRWGVKVYETSNYNRSGNVFRGISEGRATVNAAAKLPQGTYFYIINIHDGEFISYKSGYLYINE